MELKGSRALITGGSDGIGLATGVFLAGKGARVALMARRADRLTAAAVEIGPLAPPGDASQEFIPEFAVFAPPIRSERAACCVF